MFPVEIIDKNKIDKIKYIFVFLLFKNNIDKNPIPKSLKISDVAK